MTKGDGGGPATDGVPGARAPTVYVPALVNSLSRLIIKHGGRLGSFLRSFFTAEPTPGKSGTHSSSLWPMPLPYPEAFSKVAETSSSWRKRRTCLEIVLLDWFFLGKPSAAPPGLKLGAKLSGKQWRRVRQLEMLSEDKNSVFEIDASSMARAAAKTEAAADELESLHKALSSLNCAFFGRGSNSGGSINVSSFDVEPEDDFAFGCFSDDVAPKTFVAAKEITASRIAFSGEPRFDPRPYFDKETAYAYEAPITRAEGYQPLEPPPRVHIHASPTERNKLFKKMALTGRLVYIPESDVRLEYLSGLFSVGKDLDRDRLILDARPPNSAEPGLSRWTKTMASASCLSGIELGIGQVLTMSGRDIKDYFYQFAVSPERCKRNVLAAKLTARDLSFIFEKDFSAGGFVGLSTLAMGDISACEYAQCAHLGILLKSGACSPRELLQMHCAPPRGDLFVGVVIDDLVCLERIAKHMVGVSRRLDERLAIVMAEYQKAQLPTNDKKGFDNKTVASFWGIQLDGEAGIFRSNDVRFWPLVLITVRVVCLGVSTIGLLQSLAGSWISVLCLRRRLMSMMNLIFDAIACSSGPEQTIRLSGALKDELFSFCIGGILAAVNLRAEHLGELRATDSSNWGMAAVGAFAPTVVCREAMRLSLSRSVWSKLLPPRKAWLRDKGLLDASEELPGELMFDTHPFWEALGRCYVFRELWRREHSSLVHINVGEIRAVLLEERRLANNYVGLRVPFALDSQVALGALVKGRSASKALNNELEKSLCFHLGSDFYCGFGFWPSKLNRADGPTRSSGVPPPDLEKPAWLLSLESGDEVAFDSWLKTVGPQSFPTDEAYSEIGWIERIDLRTSTRLSPPERLAEKKVVKKALRSEVKFGGTISHRAAELLSKFSPKQFYFRADVDGVYEPGALDLYSGAGGVCSALVLGGCPWVLSFEILRDPAEDLLNGDVQAAVLELIGLGVFKLVGSAMVCSSFSIAVTPPVRSPRFPRGVPWMSKNMKSKVQEGNHMSDFQALIHQLCLDCLICYWTENPDSSHLWRQRKFQRYRAAHSKWVARIDMCRFGTPWKKRTRIATNISRLSGLRMFCCCAPGSSHVPLRGQHPSRKLPWTKVAQAYPRGLSKLIAAAALSECGWSSSDKLDLAGCSKTGSLRVGEAKNPGPRTRRDPREFSLEERPVQTLTSLHLGDKRWDAFLEWASKSLKSADPLELFLQVPILLAHSIRRFGDLDFRAGGSLCYYRHLVLAALRRAPTLRPFVGICWDLATRWSVVEPTEHRVPTPEPLMKALCTLGWMRGWKRWCGVLLLAFYGVARVGEVLNCSRKDLLLPSDLLEYDNSRSAYLLLRRSKTSFRQSARVQHLKIEAGPAVDILCKVFEGCETNSLLYEGSPGVFRKRWDFLLEQFGVADRLHVTPGGLRGGGAVSCYRRGLPVTDIVWRMRLKQVSTLEAYLQEVAAVSLLTELPESSRKSIKSAASLFDFLVAT